MTSTTISVQERSHRLEWQVGLFKKSVIKQAKLEHILAELGPVENLSCLDIGSDNGVISVLLRQKGGIWKSADLNDDSVNAIKQLVGGEVYQIEGALTPFSENEFDRVVIVGYLENFQGDRKFIQELHRIIKPGGELIINVPHRSSKLLGILLRMIGILETKQSSVNVGITRPALQDILGDEFRLRSDKTYTRFFSQLVETLVVFGISVLKKHKLLASKKDLMVTEAELEGFQTSYRLYSLIYPLLWLISQLDHLLFFSSGYMLIARAVSSKEPQNQQKIGARVSPEVPDIVSSSDDYARRFSGEVGEWFLKTQQDATLKMMKPYPKASVLDVGGGHGQITGGLVENNFRVTILASDEVCSKRVKNYLDQGQVNFQVGNFINMPYPDKAFDVVVTYRILAHMENWKAFLAELTRIAGSAVIFDYAEVYSLNYLTPALFRVKKSMEGNTRQYSCHSGKELVSFMKKQGFGFSGRVPQYFMPMVMHRKLQAPRVSATMENAFRSIGLTNLLGSPVILKFTREK